MLPPHDWNDTSAPYPQGESIHGIFAAIAAGRPEALCLLHGDRRISYGLLDRAANGYATRLADCGVGRGDLVPIRLPRSPELVAAVLAVLKLGAAYSLIDEAWPRPRVQEVLTQLEATVLVDARPASVAEWAPVRAWAPPAGGLASVAEDAPGFVPAEVRGQDPACVFFTSGTTGRPKGVLSPHRATVRLLRPGTLPHFAPGTVMLQAAAVPWDGYSLELWGMLLNGGTSVIVDEPYISPGVLRSGITLHGVNAAFFTTSLFNMLVDEDQECLRGLRQVVIGGERLSVPHVRRFLAAHPDTVLLNGYGPIETTMHATIHRVTAEDCDRPSGVPIGRPAPDTQVHILDGERPCGIGETGELCIAGHGLALRYLGRPELTAEKFIDVVLEGAVTRVYRSGDLAHWDEDGLLHYHGRADRQIKIRGHRVEPAEVERQIERLLPDVRRCTVLALRDESGASRALAAFCQPRQPGNELDGALRQLSPHLVSYHLPEHLLSVADFPLTANGKLDESALLALVPQAGTRADTETASHQDSGDALTDLVMHTFADVLGLPAVSPDAEFSSLGGSSLDAGRICARLAARLERAVPVSFLLRGRTARNLADRLRQDLNSTASAGAVPELAEVPLTPAQNGFLINHMLDPGNHDAHCLAAWVIDGPLDRAALGRAVADVHRRHPSLSSAYRMGRGRAFSVQNDPPAPDVVPLAGCATVEDALASVRDALDAQLDPTTGLLWRVVLASAGPSTWVLGYGVHHIAFDGWSEAVFAADLATAYNARREGRSPSWAPLPSAAQAYALRAAHLRAADAEAQRDQTAVRLRGVPELRFPGQPESTETAVLRTEVTLGPDSSAAVDELAASTRQTRFAVLLSYYVRALAKTTGQDDFGIGIPVAQRIDARLEHVVGCHIGTICVRVTPRALDADPPTAAAEAGRLVREALASQDVGIDEVARAVNPPRSSRSPLFQTLFAYQDNTPAGLPLTDCRTEFRQLPYIGTQAEIQTEIRPMREGGLRIVVNWQSAAVAPQFARELGEVLVSLITGLSAHDL